MEFYCFSCNLFVVRRMYTCSERKKLCNDRIADFEESYLSVTFISDQKKQACTILCLCLKESVL